MAKTAIFVFHADRGHFNLCVPLAKRLKNEFSVTCELWTNPICEAWVPPGCFEVVKTDLGESNLPALVANYKTSVSHGDSDADGQRYLMANIETVFAQTGPPLTVTEEGTLAFKNRLAEPDVACVVFEGQWAKWARDVALECGKNFFGLMPTYRQPFRGAYSTEPIFDFDGLEIMRNRPQDIDNFPDWPAEDASYVIADCLVGKATDSAGRRRFGPFLPESKSVQDADLLAWLDGVALPAEDRAITVISLGSQSALSSLSESAETDLIHGCLASSTRVLIASKTCTPEDPDLKESMESGKLRLMDFLPLWEVLNHGNVRCFVSHAGANSVHEAILSGTPIVPLPFFDDQFYIAMRLEELYGYVGKVEPLRKAILRSGGSPARACVEAAIRFALIVPESVVKSLQQDTLQEDGVGSAAKAIAEKME